MVAIHIKRVDITKEEVIILKIFQGTKSEGRTINNQLRREKIAELKKKNYLKKAEENFKRSFPNILSFEMNDDKAYQDKLEFIYSSKLKLKVSFEHDEQKIKSELQEFQKKTKDYLEKKVLIYNERKYEQLPNLIIKLEDFYKNLEGILAYTEANNLESYFWFILISIDETFGIFISEDEYGIDSVFYWGIE